jgi:hypothetical protein
MQAHGGPGGPSSQDVVDLTHIPDSDDDDNDDLEWLGYLNIEIVGIQVSIMPGDGVTFQLFLVRVSMFPLRCAPCPSAHCSASLTGAVLQGDCKQERNGSLGTRARQSIRQLRHPS